MRLQRFAVRTRRMRRRGSLDEKEWRLQQRRLGRSGPEVAALGLGCIGMSGMYGIADRGESLATIHAALDAG
jgi:hypothetical protein